MKLITAEDIDFYYVTTQEKLSEVATALSKVEICVLDTEVRILYEEYGDLAHWKDPHTSRVRLLQISIPNNKTPWVIDILKIGVENLDDLNTQLKRKDLIKLAWNFNYDLKVLRSTLGYWIPNAICVMVMMRRLSLCVGFKAAQLRGHSYKAMCRDVFDLHISKVEQASDWSQLNLTPSQLEYAALDVGAPKGLGIDSIILQAYYSIKKALEAPAPEGYDVKFVLDLDLEVNQALARMEYEGMPISYNVLKRLNETITEQLEVSKRQLCKDLELDVEQKVIITKAGPKIEVVISETTSKLLNNPKALTILINKQLTKTGQQLNDVQSTSVELLLNSLQKTSKQLQEEESAESDEDVINLNELENFQFGIDLVDNVLKYKTLVKAAGTNYIELINPVTKRLHTHFNVIGAATGRMSSGGENSFNSQQLATTSFSLEEINDPFECFEDTATT